MNRIKLPKIVFTALIISFCAITSKADVPDFYNFGYFSTSVGLLSGGAKNGISFGVVHTTGMWQGLITECSGFRMGYYSHTPTWEVDGITYTGQKEHEFMFLDLITFDIGLNVVMKGRFSIAIIPWSLNLAKESSGGLGFISKYRVNDNILVEAKVVPVPYIGGFDKDKHKFYDNHSYLRLSYFLGDSFALGLQHNRNGKYRTTNLSLMWSFG
jgi:hypothetical protein